ncbi:MAG: hypothetical protein AABY84_08205 [Candidatus Firestonebacteria bacterium]
MKKRFFISILLLVSMLLFSVNIYAHYNGHRKSDVKVEAKNVDKGIQLIITSDDPEVTKELQENARYYKEILSEADSFYCSDMKDMCGKH